MRFVGRLAAGRQAVSRQRLRLERGKEAIRVTLRVLLEEEGYRQARRVVLNSSGYGKGNRLFVIDFDPASGRLSFDERFRDAGSTRPGINLTGRTWPHGFAGTAVPQGTVFSR